MKVIIKCTMEEAILKTLPTLPKVTLTKLVSVLQDDLGVTSVSDLGEVRETDIEHILKPIPTRQLIKAWSQDTSPGDTIHNTSFGSGFSTEPVTSDSSFSSSSTEVDWILNFQIPWNDFPKELLLSCESSAVPNALHRLEMVRVLIDAIFKITKRPKKRDLQVIASRIIAKYPHSFKDSVGDFSLGDGKETLSNQLSERMHYCNRKQKKFGNIGEPIPKTNLKRKESYGCDMNKWCGGSESPDTSNVLTEHKDWLLEEYNKEKAVQQTSKIKELMQTTFSLQRKIINKKIQVKEIKKEWPYLLEDEYLLSHFDNLVTSGGGSSGFFHQLVKSSHNVYRTFKSSTNINICKKIWEIDQKPKMSQSVGMLELVATYFKEDISQLYQIFSKESLITEIRERAPATPFIAVIGESPATEFYVAIEQEVTARFKDFFKALVYTFCSFYVFNMVYTEKIENLLEFVQRYFAKIGECGSKTKKAKRHNVSPKVRHLCNAIKQCMEDGTDCCSEIC